uniref:Uncharacterized protein n=1 Tax=Arundo donax TaxID=35708 RepID=A0A0A9D3E5_ARUDO
MRCFCRRRRRPRTRPPWHTSAGNAPEPLPKLRQCARWATAARLLLNPALSERKRGSWNADFCFAVGLTINFPNSLQIRADFESPLGFFYLHEQW